MSQDQIEILKRALKREKSARKSAEKILEDKSKELYNISSELKESNLKLNNLLEEKLSTLKGIFENINDAYLVMDLFGNVIKMNDGAIELFGYDIKKEQFSIPDIIFEDDAEYAYRSFTILQKRGYFNNYIARVYTKKKEIKWVQINATTVFDKNNKPIAAQGIIRDITKDKEAQELLIESKNRLSVLVLNLNSGVVLEDEHRKIISSNIKFCKFFQIDAQPNELIGIDCKLVLEKNKFLFKDPSFFIRRMRDVISGEIEVFGDQLEMVDGTILERNYTPIIVSGKIKGFLWTFRDITLEKKYNLSLEAQKEKYSNIIANMNLGLMEVNTDDEILMINQGFSNMSGYSEEELLGKKGIEVYKLKSQEEVINNENLKRKKGISNSYELEIKHKNGELRYWLVSGAPNYNLNGEIIGCIGIHLDITQFRALEAQKEKIHKELEKSNNQLHEYAHIVSHDLKSPLRSIEALTSWIKSDNEGKFDEVTLQNFTLLDTTIETMEKLISGVLKYSSAGSSKQEDEDVDLNETLFSLQKTLFIPKNIQLSVLNKLPIVKGDKTKFKQLFQNFISNAIKFSDKEKGIVEIDYNDNNTFHQFSIRDNGIGIEKKYHDKIFKIFTLLNTREDSTGIGLSIVKKIIDLYEGDIWLESELGVGSVFYFTIKKYRSKSSKI